MRGLTRMFIPALPQEQPLTHFEQVAKMEELAFPRILLKEFNVCRKPSAKCSKPMC
jgi:hypothetical protein